METLHVYCVSGLGADQRVFENLYLPGFSLHPLPWLTPRRREPISEYAGRMAGGVQHEDPVLMGLSFGGLMVIEMAKHIRSRRLWLLSTVKQRSEMPAYMRLGRTIPLHKPFLLLNPHRWMGPLENYNLSPETPEEVAMVADFRKAVDPVYLRWAIDALINWDAVVLPSNTFHIHGGKDRIFPIRRARPDAVVPDAGHFMVHNRAKAVSELLLSDARAFVEGR